MLDIFRDKAQSFGVKLIFGIIIAVFVFWGMGNVNKAPVSALAVVNGSSVTVQDFNKLFQRTVEEQRKKTPDIVSDPAKFKTFKQQVLNQVIMARLLQQEAARIGLVVTPHELKRMLAGFPVFQDASGKFDPEVYKRVVASQGMTQGEFEAERSAQLLQEKLIQGVAMSADVSEAEARTIYNFSLEKRKAEYALFSAADYTKDVVVSDEDVNQYYANNKESFKTPTKVNLEFLRLTPASLASGYPVTDQEAQDYYDKNKLSFFQPESFQARHIFIACPPDGSKTAGAEEKIKQAQAAIEDIAKQLKGGANFATLATARSEDKQSAVDGGMLGWLSKGQIGSEEFENAALALAPGEISKPVRTEVGFHIIKLEAKKSAVTPPLADVKKDIVAAISQSKADADFSVVEKAAEDGLAMNTAFAELGKKFHVAAVTTGLIAQSEAESQLAPQKDSRQILADAIAGLTATPADKDGKTASAMTLPVPLNIEGGVALVRILEAKPAAIPPLDEVRSAIVEQLKQSKGTVLARAAAEAALPQFTGKSVPAAYKDKVKESGDAVRLFPEVRPFGLMPDLVNALFSSSGDWLPQTFATPEGTIIVRTKDIEPVTEENWNQMKDIFMPQLIQSRQREAVEAFMQNLITSAKIEEAPDALDKLSMR